MTCAPTKHKWAMYQGFTDSFEHCASCGMKRKDWKEPSITPDIVWLNDTAPMIVRMPQHQMIGGGGSGPLGGIASSQPQQQGFGGGGGGSGMGQPQQQQQPQHQGLSNRLSIEEFVIQSARDYMMKHGATDIECLMSTRDWQDLETSLGSRVQYGQVGLTKINEIMIRSAAGWVKCIQNVYQMDNSIVLGNRGRNIASMIFHR